MRQIGIVEEINGKNIRVRVKRTSACGENCASCKGGCTPSQTVVNAVNQAGAKLGDTVILEMETSKVLFAAFLVYIVPLLCMIFGYLLGDFLFGREAGGILTGVVFMVISFFLLKRVDRKLRNGYILIVVGIL